MYTVDNIVVDCIVVVKNLSIVVCVVVDCIVVVDPTLIVVHTVRELLILYTVCKNLRELQRGLVWRTVVHSVNTLNPIVHQDFHNLKVNVAFYHGRM